MLTQLWKYNLSNHEDPKLARSR